MLSTPLYITILLVSAALVSAESIIFFVQPIIK